MTQYIIAFMKQGKPYKPVVQNLSNLDNARKYAIRRLEKQSEFTGINIEPYVPIKGFGQTKTYANTIGRISKRFPADDWNYYHSLEMSNCKYAWFSSKTGNMYEVFENGKLGKKLNPYIDFN